MYSNNIFIGHQLLSIDQLMTTVTNFNVEVRNSEPNLAKHKKVFKQARQFEQSLSYIIKFLLILTSSIHELLANSNKQHFSWQGNKNWSLRRLNN